MASIVFDSSVVLAHLNKEPGSEYAAGLFGDALISSVNLAEVIGKLVERGARLDVIRMALSRYGMQTVDYDEALAERTGALRLQTKELGLSLGDRACLALAEAWSLPVLTADRNWAKLTLSVEIRMLR